MMMWTTREAFRREVGALYDAKRRFLEAQTAEQPRDLLVVQTSGQRLLLAQWSG